MQPPRGHKTITTIVSLAANHGDLSGSGGM